MDRTDGSEYGVMQENQLNLFNTQADPILETIKSVIEEMDINNLTPIAALNKIQELKEIIGHE